MIATNPSPATTTASHLTTVIDHWGDLADALTTRQTSDWPPAMGISKLHEPDEDGDGRTGDVRTLPIRPEVFDTMQEVTRALVACADQVAAEIQRGPARAFRGAGKLDQIGQQLAMLAAKDAADPGRWRFTGQRTAAQAATWLLARIQDRPGPVTPLHAGHRERIDAVASGCAVATARVLRIVRLTTKTGQHCACGGELEIHGGDGQAPVIKCPTCGRKWTGRTSDVA